MDLQSNVVTIVPAPDRVLDLAALPEAVRRSGFRPGALRLRAEGRFVARNGGAGFRIRGWPEAFPVPALPPEGEADARVEAAVHLDGGVIRLEDVASAPAAAQRR